MRYIIKEGHHYSNASWWQRIRPLFGRSFEATFELTPSCMYPSSVVQHSGKNKIVGRSWGFHHHNNSVRVVWQPAHLYQQGGFKLFLYWYSGGKLYWDYLCHTHAYQPISISMDSIWGGNAIDFRLTHLSANKPQVHRVIGFKKLRPWGWRLFPYFGGQDAAYRDVEVIVDFK